MNLFNSLIDQAKQRWERTNIVGRISGVVTLVLAISAIVAVGVWSSRTEYVALAHNLAPTETADYVSKLDAAGIPSQMNAVGSAVLVPRKQLNKARVAVGDLIVPGSQLDDGSSGGIFDDQEANSYRLQRLREAELEATILKLRSVTSVEVHIAQPKWTPFVRHQRATTASVLIGTRPGAIFTHEQAATLVDLVAGAVEGLTPNNITVSDLEGRMLLHHGRSGDTGFLAQYDYRRQLEAELSNKAEMMLRQQLGPDKAIVRVTATVDFTESVIEVTTYEGKGQKVSEEIDTSTTRPTNTSGPAGTSSNLPGGTSTHNTESMITETEKLQTEWMAAPRVEMTTKAPGSITHLSVAVMVDLNSGITAPAAEGGGAQPTVTKDQIEAMVKHAIGFDASRGDQIDVLITKMLPPSNDYISTVSTTKKWEFVNQLARNSSLGLAAVSALIIVILTLRKLKPITITSSNLDDDSRHREQLLSELSHRVQENPETVSRILSAWLGENAPKAEGVADGPDTIPMRRAA